MFIREQLIRSVYDLKPSYECNEMLDIYINSPKSCRWQNWTFTPGYFYTKAINTLDGQMSKAIRAFEDEPSL